MKGGTDYQPTRGKKTYLNREGGIGKPDQGEAHDHYLEEPFPINWP
jgi:hypothetical protein